MKEKKEFLTESKQLLNLMINSIYSNNEIFLRELISNASDAIDKYNFLGLTDVEHYPKCDHEIRISVDKEKRVLYLKDTGIGMSKADLEKNLGTIAKSGSKEFLKKYKDAGDNKATNIIGQFGVGFYSVFMVAKAVEVKSKTNSSKPYLFSSNGVDSYTLEDTTFDVDHGTEISIYLKDDTEDIKYSNYLEEYEITELIKKYSDFIRYPIKMQVKEVKPNLDSSGKVIEGQTHEEIIDKTLNSMIPLWKKAKKDIKETELNSFYQKRFEDYEKPFLSLPIKMEGSLTYESLLFIPAHEPYNLYSENYQKGLALYSRGIFIKEKCEELLPDYLKFVKGLIDCDDLPLNISREMLQSSAIIRKIANNIESKIIERLKELLKKCPDKYNDFYKVFGDYIKYGIYYSYGQKKEMLQDLLTYQSLLSEKPVTFKDYIDAKNKDQKYIYYACGKTIDEIKLLPQIEKFKKSKINVLFLTSNIDEFTLLMIKDYSSTEFRNIASETGEELSEKEKGKIEELSTKYKRLLDNLTEALKGKVDKVSFSSKLVESPVCISTKDGLSLSMEHILDNQIDNKNKDEDKKPKAIKVLEINPEHDLFNSISSLNDDETKYYASILYDEALLLEGYDIENKREFITKLNKLIVQANKK